MAANPTTAAAINPITNSRAEADEIVLKSPTAAIPAPSMIGGAVLIAACGQLQHLQAKTNECVRLLCLAEG